MTTSILLSERIPKIVQQKMWSMGRRLVDLIPTQGLESSRISRLSMENVAWVVTQTLRVTQQWRATTQRPLFI